MKTIFKILLGLIIFLIILVVVPIAFLYFSLVDKKDEAPVTLYNSNISLTQELTNAYSEAFLLDGKESIDLLFDEDDLNKVIFALVRENINPDFMPTENCNDDKCKYIMFEEFNLPVVGKKEAKVKNIYAQINDHQLGLYMTMEVMGLQTKAKLTTKFSENDEEFKITFTTLGVGSANLVSGFAGDVLNFILEKSNITEKVVNQAFVDADLPFVLNLEDNSLNISKDEIAKMLEKVIDPDEIADDKNRQVMVEFISMITNKENDIVDFGVFDDQFGIRFDLQKFLVSDEYVKLDDNIKTFNENLFIKNKVQTFIFSQLSEGMDSKISFTNLEINQIIYNQSEGYQDFLISLPLPNSSVSIDIKIIGITFAFTETALTLKVNVDINGMKTSLKLIGDIINNDSKSVLIKFHEDMSLGEEPGKEEFIKAKSALILSVIGDSLNETGIMSYSKADNALVLTEESFEKFMKVDESTTPLQVQKIKIVNGGIDIYAYANTTDFFFADLDEAISKVGELLEGSIYNEDLFDVSDDEEQGKVLLLLDNLDSVAEDLQNNSLSENGINELVESINSLSQDNQQVFFDTLEDNYSGSELEGLYDALFGN